nr:hypothetical protein GCM10020063_060860 [Dactylosporangium thailandense]
MTCCAVESVHGRELTVVGLDAVSGTPVIDLKPAMTEFLPDVGEAYPKPGALCEPYLRCAWSSRMACPRGPRPRPRSAGSPRRSPGTIPPGSAIFRALSPQHRYLASHDAQAWDRTFSRLRLPAERSSWRAAAGLA